MLENALDKSIGFCANKKTIYFMFQNNTLLCTYVIICKPEHLYTF